MAFNRDYFLRAILAIEGASQITKTTAPATSNADWLPTPHASDTVDNALAQFFGELASSDTNQDRFALMTTALKIPTNTVLGPAVADRVGNIISVRVTQSVAGTPTDAEYLASEEDDAIAIDSYNRRKAAGRLVIPRYRYFIDGNRIWHTGTYAAVDYIPTSILTDYTKVPARYANLIIAIALSMLPVACSATRINGASYFRGWADNGLALLRENKPMLTPVPPYTGD